MKKFKIVKQNLIGFTKYQCYTCKNIFGVPKNRKKEKFVWCMYCGEEEYKKGEKYE